MTTILPSLLAGKRILLIVSGGIAAYKALDLVRRLRERGAGVRVVMTRGAQEFVTPLSFAAISGEQIYTDLFSLTDEADMGHLQLSQDSDLLIVAPATADILAKMANGIADDLASTVLLASDRPILVAPAMNHRMWAHPATVANMATLRARGVRLAGPEAGPLAENESGMGRMSEPLDIVAAVEGYIGADAPLAGRRALVTSGPTREAIDPVRYLSNHSSGKQGHAIAGALSRLGAETTLVTGPTAEPDPAGVTVIRIETAREMLEACTTALPVDVAVCAAAVSDWRVASESAQKMKKDGKGAPSLSFIENPDILQTLSRPGDRRPALVVGFAAETEKLIEHARAKLEKKGCDWILANDVSPGTGTFGGEASTIHLVSGDGVEDWPTMSKTDAAARLAAKVAEALEAGS